MKISDRTRNEIIGSILESANGTCITMTEILYKTYLSHSLLKKYLSFLLERGLVEYETCKRTKHAKEPSKLQQKEYNLYLHMNECKNLSSQKQQYPDKDS